MLISMSFSRTKSAHVNFVRSRSILIAQTIWWLLKKAVWTRKRSLSICKRRGKNFGCGVIMRIWWALKENYALFTLWA